jgi:hypothetical protein
MVIYLRFAGFNRDFGRSYSGGHPCLAEKALEVIRAAENPDRQHFQRYSLFEKNMDGFINDPHTAAANLPLYVVIAED